MYRTNLRARLMGAMIASLLLIGWVVPVQAQKSTLPDSWADQIKFRSIGPANMMGRITSIAVYEKDPNIWWAASASGGLIKTVNNGLDFEHQFDDQPTVSVGDVQVSQSDPNLVWVGTGEANPRNSVSWGDGVYKSTDGGKTWKHMGLKESFQIGRIAIHPENNDIVFVGALGRLWGPNEQRGLFKTTDGGKTWKKVLYIDDKTGVVDVQINPKKPNEMLVATYERMRDGFDGNDPVKKYGPGSGIYKSTDGGETFARVTEGLPTCHLGRIGLNYYRKDPRIVVAIVESEKIAQEPPDAAFAGLRGDDADVGARITSVTSDGPAEKAGLKAGDIIVMVGGQLVTSYDELLKQIRMHKAGETVKLVVARDREKIDLKLELGKRPERRSRSGRNARRNTPFTGTLGGQAANLQGQQGDDEHEYGGVYMSRDGGDTWKRINTLNPRPMYYSQIRIDPSDKRYMYVCGTSLYRSKDGGKTFTGDGNSDGIHVDNHALWIDPRDGRHMILGCDGGVYVTYDRMDNWDHHNQVAIGQFYHISVDHRWNYNVYGGLQDNGSWGGPAHVTNDSGPVNTDWFRVGGGDGFVTIADPEDPDQIYFESQNGGMGRINLRTGERGFIRPRPPRGVRYRFNWKTPFILSPHNSKIHYSAGNYVFRSPYKGDKIEAISPEITNTDKGAGSALTESPVKPGVLYVGTTDGAVWMTRDHGKEWVPIFVRKEEPKQDEAGDESADKDPEASEKSAESSSESSEAGQTEKTAEETAEAGRTSGESESSDEAKSEMAAPESDPLSGTWEGKLISERFREGQAPAVSFQIQLMKDGSVTGEVEMRRGSAEITEGTFDPKTGELSFIVEGERGEREFTATVKGNKMSGEMTAGGGRFTVEFEATKKDDGLSLSVSRWWSTQSLLGAALFVSPSRFDELAGKWSCVIENEDLPNGRIEFTMELKVDEKNQITGLIESPQGEMEVIEGEYNPKDKSAFWIAELDDMAFDFEVKIDGAKMTGDISINNGEMEFEFAGSRDEAAESTPAADAPAGKADSPEPSDAVEPKAEMQKAEQETVKDASDKEVTQEQEAKSEAESKTETEGETKAPAAQANSDPVSGTWEGSLQSPQGESELTLVLKRKSDQEITGEYRTSRGEGEITEGTYNPESRELQLLADTGRFTIEFVGKLEGKTFAGTMDFNGGQFSIDFSVTRQGQAPAVAGDQSDDADQAVSEEAQAGKLEDLVPGPRWVSSLEASRFKEGRCYITLDGHRSNDDMPYLFVTEDFGKSWKSIKGNLPDSAGSVRVLREDLFNENLLFLGCEFGGWVSIDRGETWTRLKGLPTVAVHEFAIHPKTGEVAVGTHGRSIWIADVSGLRQFTPENISAKTVLYKPNVVIRWRRVTSRGDTGPASFKGENRKDGATLQYSLGKNANEVEMEIRDITGRAIYEFEELETSAGLHTVDWNLRTTRRGGSRGGRFRGRFGGPSVAPGTYLVVLTVDGQEFKQPLEIRRDPTAPADALDASDLQAFWEEVVDGIDD